MINNGIGIIHLSDIHLISENDKIVNKIDLIVNSIKNKCIDLELVVIVITGDIVFSGAESQYDIAYCMISDLIENLKKYIGKDVEVLFAPGNHDCNFDNDNSVRKVIVNSILNDGKVDNSKIDVCCSVQDEYFTFKKNFNNIIAEKVFEDKLIEINKFETKQGKIFFIMLNTAWLSEKKEISGNIYFPIDRYKDELNKCKDGIVITGFHHPTKWCHAIISNYIDNQIECISDFICLGHEHEKDEYMKIGKSNKVVYIKSAALQEKPQSDESKFNFIVINNKEGLYLKNTYSYCEGMYRCDYSDEWISYLEIISKKSKRFTMTPQNVKFITDIGANLSHPRKDKLLLDDIFVYPILEEFSINQEKNDDFREIQINSKDIINEKFSLPIIIYGDEKFGKTCLGKKLYLDYFEMDYCPIFLNSNSIKKYIDNVDKLILKSFTEQYEDDPERFNQLDNNKKVIIIDDFDKLDTPRKIKEKFLEKIISIYKNTIILCNNMFDLQDLITGSNEYIINISLKQFKLKKFGYALRNRLINKWNIIGREELEGENDILVINEETLRRMNTIIGNNYVPSVPFYLLIILQAFEVGNEHNFNDSSYGYYYEYLILQTLNKISNKQGDKEAFINFMVCLAKKFYDEKINKISHENLKNFHTWFCAEYRVSSTFKSFINFEEFVYDMCKSNLLCNIYDMYQFSYKYIYYYSIGKYFGDNIEKMDIQVEVSKIISKLHIEEYANIVIFIIHHTKNEFVLNQLLACAINILKDKQFVKLQDDISFINELQSELPQIVIENIDIDENRQNKLDKLDKELNETESEIAYTKDDEDNIEINKINELNFAFKTMEILGQILKNYWGSLKGDVRQKIGCELYLVGLRSLRETYDIFNDARQNLVSIIEKEIEIKNITDIEEIKKRTRKMLFLFSALFTQSCIDKVASCIGDDKLSETFKDIEENIEFNSVKMINLAIQLEYFGGKFPYSYVESLLKENKNNLLATFLIKHMVRNYLYMYKTTVSDKSKISALIDIPIKTIDMHNIKEMKMINKNI